MVKLKVYISGKITGLPIAEARAKFEKAEIMFKEKDLEPVNPFKVCKDIEGPYTTWEEYMVRDLEALLGCNAIYMLDNWGASKGARVEHAVAQALGLVVHYENSN